MGNIEDLLSNIKAEQQKAEPAAPNPPGERSSEERSPLPGETRSVEDLLAQLEGQPPQGHVPQSSQGLPSQGQSSQRSQGNPQSAAALNAPLADLSVSKPTLPSPLDQILAQPSPKPLDLSNLPPVARGADPLPGLSSAPLPILEDLKAQYVEEQRQREAQERAEQERRRQEQEAALAQQRLEQERQAKEKQARVEKAAQAWLSQLHPLSGEAIWFDEFSRHYASRLEAAIDYLNLDE